MGRVLGSESVARNVSVLFTAMGVYSLYQECLFLALVGWWVYTGIVGRLAVLSTSTRRFIRC